MSFFTKICTGLMISTLSLTAYAGGSEIPAQEPFEQPVDVDVENVTEVIQALFVSNSVGVRIADLVRERSTDEDLRRLADDIERDHEWMNRMLQEIANKNSVSLSPGQLSESVQKIESQLNEEVETLVQRPEAEFRASALEAIIEQHEKILEFYNQIEQNTMDTALKAVIVAHRPLEEKHLADARRLQSEEPGTR